MGFSGEIVGGGASCGYGPMETSSAAGGQRVRAVEPSVLVGRLAERTGPEAHALRLAHAANGVDRELDVTPANPLVVEDERGVIGAREQRYSGRGRQALTYRCRREHQVDEPVHR